MTGTVIIRGKRHECYSTREVLALILAELTPDGKSGKRQQPPRKRQTRKPARGR